VSKPSSKLNGGSQTCRGVSIMLTYDAVSYKSQDPTLNRRGSSSGVNRKECGSAKRCIDGWQAL
jgi:hypothetical protein